MHLTGEGTHLFAKILLIMCFVGDNSSFTGINANVVYVSDRCTNNEQRDDQYSDLPTAIPRPLGLKKGMSITSLNINGLRTHIDWVALLIQNLRIHAIVLCETKLGTSFPRELAVINGYIQERDRTCNGEGVSIYIRNSINYQRRTDLPRGDLELIYIKVLPYRNKPFLLLAWY